MISLDPLDLMILSELQADGRMANAELARRVNLSPPAVHARVRRLEEQGVIRSYAALLDRSALGYDMLCFIHISLQLHTSEQVQRFRLAIQDIGEVLECHHVTGEFDYLLKAVVRNSKDLERLLVERLTPIHGVARIHTSLALSQVKATTALPVE